MKLNNLEITPNQTQKTGAQYNFYRMPTKTKDLNLANTPQRPKNITRNFPINPKENAHTFIG